MPITDAKFKLLVVDDEALSRLSLQCLLEREKFQVDLAATASEAISKFQTQPFAYALVLLDYRMHPLNGAAIASELRKINPDVFILMFSGDASRDALKESWKAGALEFIDKSSPTEILLSKINTWCRKYAETNLPAGQLIPDEPTKAQELIASIGLVGVSQSLADVAKLVRIHCKTNRNVLIEGESGTGKELIARALHNGTGQFIAINCASYRTNPVLLESALFGHSKGAFTGADKDKRGAFEEASGGTVFLDELHHLNPDVQVSILRTIQERKVTRIGSSTEIPVNFRLVAAAKPDLAAEIDRGSFRLDLYYRIKGATITLSPLRERPEDIEPLVAHFCNRWAKENGTTKTILARTVRYLERYPWPGNVRELENAVFELLDLSERNKISPDELDSKFFTSNPDSVDKNGLSLKSRIHALESQHIQNVVKQSRSLRDAARKMDISPQTLIRLLRKHSMHEPSNEKNGTPTSPGRTLQ